jgi:hypothetical protein
MTKMGKTIDKLIRKIGEKVSSELMNDPGNSACHNSYEGWSCSRAPDHSGYHVASVGDLVCCIWEHDYGEYGDDNDGDF